MATLEIRVRDADGVTFFELTGCLSMADGDLRLREEFRVALEQGCRHFVMDLAQVNHVDSAGLGELIACKKRVLEHGGELALLRPRPRVRELLWMVRLTDVLGVYEDTGEASRAVLQGRATP